MQITRMLLLATLSFILFLNPPFVFSTPIAHFPHHPPRLTNASDQHALLAFKSAITYDPFQSLAATWKPNVSFCEWTGIICSRRRQRVVSLNVSHMGLQARRTKCDESRGKLFDDFSVATHVHILKPQVVSLNVSSVLQNNDKNSQTRSQDLLVERDEGDHRLDTQL